MVLGPQVSVNCAWAIIAAGVAVRGDFHLNRIKFSDNKESSNLTMVNPPLSLCAVFLMGLIRILTFDFK